MFLYIPLQILAIVLGKSYVAHWCESGVSHECSFFAATVLVQLFGDLWRVGDHGGGRDRRGSPRFN
jgi:hypothetical protein